MPLTPGQMLSHFRLLEKIGQGGMGVVWKAEDTLLGRTVAVKILPAQSARDEKLRRMFLDEARLASSLSDAHIAQVHELGHDKDLDFIVMEHVEGSPLSRLVAAGRPLPHSTITSLGAQVAEALARTHRKGLLHRDLKPANIIVDEEGCAKVVDFGLATLFQKRDAPAVAEAPTLATAPADSSILGTPFYMSPEQVRVEPLDGRTDIFSLGVVLYQMTTGRLPFSGDTTEAVLGQILKGHPTPARDLVARLPFELDRILQKTMATRRTDRYQTMEDLAVDLRRLGEQLESGSAPSYAELKRDAVPHALPAARRSLWIVVGIAAAVAVMLGARSWLAYRQEHLMKADGTLLILPLDVRGQAEGAEYAGRAFAEALAVNLARLKGVSVLPVPSSGLPREADSLASARAAREAGAGRVLGGALTREGAVVHATINLVDAAANRIVWGAQEKAPDDDLPRLASSLARQAATALGAEPPHLYESFKNEIPAPDVAASPDYGRTMAALRLYDTAEAIATTGRLAEAFPKDHLVRVLRSYALALDAVEFSPGSPQRRAFDESIEWIASTDPNSPWDEVFRARFLHRDGQNSEAVRIFSEVLARDDLTASARAYVLNGRSLAEVRLPDAAAAEADLREALRLDPLNDVINLTMTRALMDQKRMDEALERARHGVALNPYSPWNMQTLGDALYHMGRYAEAADVLGRACARDRLQTSCSFQAVALVKAGRAEEARLAAEHAAALAESDLGAYNLACYNALVGRKTEALRLLRRSLELGPLESKEILEDAALSSLHDEPSFKSLVDEVSRQAGRR